MGIKKLDNVDVIIGICADECYYGSPVVAFNLKVTLLCMLEIKDSRYREYIQKEIVKYASKLIKLKDNDTTGD